MPRFQRARSWPTVQSAVPASVARTLISPARPSSGCAPWGRRRKRIDADATGNRSTNPNITEFTISGGFAFVPANCNGLRVPPITGRNREPDETNNSRLFHKRFERRSAGARLTASNQVSGNTGHS